MNSEEPAALPWVGARTHRGAVGFQRQRKLVEREYMEGIWKGDIHLYCNASVKQQRPLTGWCNGDFNCDGVVDGSDYTLIDDAFNTPGGNLSSTNQIAASTVQIAGTTAVPSPRRYGLRPC